MRGLLIKDIRLIANMKNSLFLILLISVGLSTYTSNVSFLVMYLGFIGTSFTSSTLSYDEFDNGYAFLFSLPVTRRGYAVEKYLFGLLISLGGWLLGTVLAVVSSIVKDGRVSRDIITAALLMLPMVLILLSVLLPFHMKFGGEKGRMVMVCVAGGVFALMLLAAKVVKDLGLDPESAWERLAALDTRAMVVGAAAVGLVVLLLSCRISMSIMERKEF